MEGYSVFFVKTQKCCHAATRFVGSHQRRGKQLEGGETVYALRLGEITWLVLTDSPPLDPES